MTSEAGCGGTCSICRATHCHRRVIINHRDSWGAESSISTVLNGVLCSLHLVLNGGMTPFCLSLAFKGVYPFV